MTRNLAIFAQRAARSAILLTAIGAALFAVAACATPPRGRGTPSTTQGAEAWLSGKTWRLAGYSYAGQFIPLEPGHGTTARVAFSADGSLAGFTGSNAFGGSWRLGKETAKDTRAFAATVSGLGKKAAPNEIAARFEADLVRELAAARALKREKDAFALLDGHGGILLRFIFSAAGDLY